MYIYIYIFYISSNLQFSLSFLSLQHIWATKILTLVIILTSQAWSALIDPQAMFSGTD